jgi:hypothetical protein
MVSFSSLFTSFKRNPTTPSTSAPDYTPRRSSVAIDPLLWNLLHPSPDQSPSIHAAHYIIPDVSSSTATHLRFWIVSTQPPTPFKKRLPISLYDPQEGHLFHGQIQSQRVYSSAWRIYKLNSPYPSQSHILCLPTQFAPLSPLETLWHTRMHPARDPEPWYIKTMQTTPEGMVGWAQIPAETYMEVTRVEEAFRREVPAEEDYEAAIDTLFDCGEEIEETGMVLLS